MSSRAHVARLHCTLHLHACAWGHAQGRAREKKAWRSVVPAGCGMCSAHVHRRPDISKRHLRRPGAAHACTSPSYPMYFCRLCRERWWLMAEVVAVCPSHVGRPRRGAMPDTPAAASCPAPQVCACMDRTFDNLSLCVRTACYCCACCCGKQLQQHLWAAADGEPRAHVRLVV